VSDEPPLETGVEERVEVRIMEVSLVAVDRDEMPVLDLGAEDLTVIVGGNEREVAYLDHVAARLEDAAPLPNARLYLKVKSDYDEAVTMPSEPRYYLFLVDVENNDLLRRDEEMHSMQEFIDEGIRDHDLAAVLSYNGALDVEQPFTRDHEQLKQGVARAFDAPRRPTALVYHRIESLIQQAEMCEDMGGSQTVTSGEPALSGGVPADELCLQDLAHQYQQEHRAGAEDFMRALEAAVRIAGGLQGRATIFVYSHGATLNPVFEIRQSFEAVFGPEVQNLNLSIDYDSPNNLFLDRVLDLAARERVSLHFVDTTVEGPGVMSARRRGMLQTHARPFEVAYESPQGTLRQIAGETGGSFWQTQDVGEGLTRAMAIEQGRYHLGVSLDAAAMTRKKLPKVLVSSNRPGVRILVGRGIRARPAPTDTIGGRITPGDSIALPDGKGMLVPFMIGFDVQDLGYERSKKKNDNTRVTVYLSVQLSLQTADGRHIASSYHWIEHALSHDGKDAPTGVLAFKGGVEGPPGDYRLIAFVRNIRTGDGGRIVREITLGASGGT
jgi:VWFA-related protein